MGDTIPGSFGICHWTFGICHLKRHHFVIFFPLTWMSLRGSSSWIFFVSFRGPSQTTHDSNFTNATMSHNERPKAKTIGNDPPISRASLVIGWTASCNHSSWYWNRTFQVRSTNYESRCLSARAWPRHLPIHTLAQPLFPLLTETVGDPCRVSTKPAPERTGLRTC